METLISSPSIFRILFNNTLFPNSQPSVIFLAINNNMKKIYSVHVHTLNKNETKFQETSELAWTVEKSICSIH